MFLSLRRLALTAYKSPSIKIIIVHELIVIMRLTHVTDKLIYLTATFRYFNLSFLLIRITIIFS